MAFYNVEAMGQRTATESIVPARAGEAIPQWLALKEASDFLGVHFTTLRTWADNGDIPVFRTPGGHRRFSLDDLRRFLVQRSQLATTDEHGLVSVAVDRAREELERQLPIEHQWRYPLQGDAVQARRQRGRQLFALAVSFVLKPGQSGRLLEQGRELGREYGWEAAQSGVGLAETGKAVQFFRSQLVETVRHQEGAALPDADDLRVQRQIDLFLDEVLYAVLDGYERGRGAN
jgi:excisionase family DNA binding protein